MNCVSPRKAIIERRDEANTCIRHDLYTAATLTACSGVELLLESVFTEYYISILRDDRRRARDFLADREKWNEEHGLKHQWALGHWIRYFEASGIPGKIKAHFGTDINILRLRTLESINIEWNKCKHEIYVASPQSATYIVDILNKSLEELDFLAGDGNDEHASVAQLNKKWQNHWGNKISDWTAQSQNFTYSELLSRLSPLLNLVVGMACDPRIDFELKTSLLVAAHYVYSAIDLIPDVQDNVRTLVDDVAVLVLTMSWLIKVKKISNKLINEHWSGKEEASHEILRLEQYVFDNKRSLFHEKRGTDGTNVVWKTISRVAKDGPEALWQNYWAEAY